MAVQRKALSNSIAKLSTSCMFKQFRWEHYLHLFTLHIALAILHIFLFAQVIFGIVFIEKKIKYNI